MVVICPSVNVLNRHKTRNELTFQHQGKIVDCDLENHSGLMVWMKHQYILIWLLAYLKLMLDSVMKEWMDRSDGRCDMSADAAANSPMGTGSASLKGH